ncbi:MAG TPA: hypothetical protein VJ001_03305, partial [Rhodocyclaceae bacterium]|nr:hypothetical protein [Rhodocyclaceae bacterium]
MCPKFQRGFSILAAIFILVVLASLGGFILSVSSTQHLSQAQDILGSRAQLAARSGIEWGSYQAIRAPGGAFATACRTGAGYGGAPAASQTLNGLPGLAEFTIVVTCHSNAYQEGAAAYRVYQLVATACNNANCPAATPP